MKAKRRESLPHFCLVKVTEDISVLLQAIHKMFWLVPSADMLALPTRRWDLLLQCELWYGNEQAKKTALLQVRYGIWTDIPRLVRTHQV